MSRKLEMEGVILSTDEHGNKQIQRIDDAEAWMEENEVEYVKQLDSDDEALEVVKNLVIDNYTEKIYQDLQEGNKELLYSLLSGTGLLPINKLTEEELIREAKELDIL